MKYKLSFRMMSWIIIIIAVVGYALYTAYNMFFTNNSEWFDILFVATVAIVLVVVVITVLLSLIADRYPNSRVLQWAKKGWDEFADMIEHGLNGL